MKLSVLLTTVWVAATMCVDEKPSINSDRARRIELIRGFASRHRIATTAQPVRDFKLRRQPLLYWTSPTRGDAFGGTFLWLRNGRPMAFGGVYLWFTKSGTELSREFHSLTNESITAHFDDEKTWAPNQPGVKFRVIPGNKPPARSRALRLLQIKEIASRFSASISSSKTKPELVRRLPTPIYRYPGTVSDATDGAMVAFVKGTDPEAILLIEADSNRWQYAVARCTSWAVTVRFDKEVVYKVPMYDFSNSVVSSPFFIPNRKAVD